MTTKKNEATKKKGAASASSAAKEQQERNTLLWWATLSLISVFNIAVWLYSYRTLSLAFIESGDADGSAHHSSPHYSYQRSHLVLSGIYVIVCAYRSFLPRIDLERYCLWDTILSSIFLGRTAATIAEISFAGQIALFLHRLGTVHDHPWSIALAYTLVPAITIAQCFCWCGVVTLNHGYHAIEESMWAVASLFVGLEMGTLVIYHPENQYLCRLGVLGSIACLAFFWFMVTVDVPMYIRRWKEGRMEKCIVKSVGKTFTRIALPPPRRMSTFEGGKDALQRRVVTKSWDVWREETVWLTGYFSSAVWLSLLFIHLPVMKV